MSREQIPGNKINEMSDRRVFTIYRSYGKMIDQRGGKSAWTECKRDTWSDCWRAHCRVDFEVDVLSRDWVETEIIFGKHWMVSYQQSSWNFLPTSWRWSGRWTRDAVMFIDEELNFVWTTELSIEATSKTEIHHEDSRYRFCNKVHALPWNLHRCFMEKFQTSRENNCLTEPELIKVFHG